MEIWKPNKSGLSNKISLQIEKSKILHNGYAFNNLMI